MLKIVADDKIPFLKGALEDVAKVVYLPGEKIDRHHIKDADALIIRTRTICNKDLLQGSGIKFIATATIGYDHIDTNYCKSNNIQWANAPGCNSGSVNQYIASALSYIVHVSGKKFSDITLGIIGVGNVGSKVEKMARLLGMRLLLNDPPRARSEHLSNFTQLDELVAKSDIITMHVPLIRGGQESTFHMAADSFFGAMKRGAWFINTSRGEVVKTLSLINILKNKHLAGVILDVWENEPNIDLELMSLVDLATPHIAGYSVDGKANGTAMSVQSVSRFFDLGLDSWKPEALPTVPIDTLKIEGDGKTVEEIFANASLQAYNISYDSNKLKHNPNTFENQRGNYPIRREPENIRAIIADDDKNALKLLLNLGYLLKD